MTQEEKIKKLEEKVLFLERKLYRTMGFLRGFILNQTNYFDSNSVTYRRELAAEIYSLMCEKQ